MVLCCRILHTIARQPLISLSLKMIDAVEGAREEAERVLGPMEMEIVRNEV